MEYSIGEIVKHAREKQKMARETLAKRLSISDGYMRHIERDAPVRISTRLVDGLKKTLGKEVSAIEPLVDAHNARQRRYTKKIAKKAEKNTEKKAPDSKQLLRDFENVFQQVIESSDLNLTEIALSIRNMILRVGEEAQKAVQIVTESRVKSTAAKDGPVEIPLPKWAKKKPKTGKKKTKAA